MHDPTLWWAAAAALALVAGLLVYGLRQWRKAQRAADARLQAEHNALLLAERALRQRAEEQRIRADTEAARAAAAQSDALHRAAAARADEERLLQERLALERLERERLLEERLERERLEQARAAETREAEQRLSDERLATARKAAELEAARSVRSAPVSPAAPTAVPAPAPPRRPEDTLVMVADDSKVVRVKTSRLLAQHRYRVVVAEDGDAAARLIESEVPLVLITDVEMPGMDGFALTRHVRAHPRASHIPIIMITSADDRLQQAAADAGVTLVLGKPYAEDALIACIERAQAMSPADAAAPA